MSAKEELPTIMYWWEYPWNVRCSERINRRIIMVRWAGRRGEIPFEQGLQDLLSIKPLAIKRFFLILREKCPLMKLCMSWKQDTATLNASWRGLERIARIRWFEGENYDTRGRGYGRGHERLFFSTLKHSSLIFKECLISLTQGIYEMIQMMKRSEQWWKTEQYIWLADASDLKFMENSYYRRGETRVTAMPAARKNHIRGLHWPYWLCRKPWRSSMTWRYQPRGLCWLLLQCHRSHQC